MIHYPKRILIVEDNDLDAKLMKDLLERRGYQTLRTCDGLEAINLTFEQLRILS
jgi:two-component system cell cycle response regulator DivK